MYTKQRLGWTLALQFLPIKSQDREIKKRREDITERVLEEDLASYIFPEHHKGDYRKIRKHKSVCVK